MCVCELCAHMQGSGRDSWTLDHTFGLKTQRMTHTQAFLTARSHKVWRSDFSLHGTGRHFNLKAGILLPVCPSKLYFQPYQGLRSPFEETPASLAWFGCNSRDGGIQGQQSLSPPPTTLGTRAYTHTTRAISWRLDFFFKALLPSEEPRNLF